MSQAEDFKPLRLQKLPFLVFKLATGLMTDHEAVKLALTSNKTENLLLNSRRSKRNKKKSIHTIYIERENAASIQLRNEASLITVSHEFDFLNPESLTMGECSKWFYERKSLVENTKAVYARLNRLIPSEKLTIILKNVVEDDIDNILFCKEFHHWTEMIVDKNLHGNTIANIINHGNSSRTINLNSAVPLSFRHEFPFNFSKCHYTDARWVRVENLMTIQNSTKIILEKCKLRSEHLNQFLHHIAHCGYKVCNKIKFLFKKRIDRSSLFNGLTVLEVVFLFSTVFFFRVEITNKKRLAAIEMSGRSMSIRVSSPAPRALNAYEVLEILEEKKVLENRIAENTADVPPEVNQQLVEIGEKLATLGVIVSEDGKAKMDAGPVSFRS